MKADFNDTSATFAKYQLTVTLDVDSDDILYSSSNRVGVVGVNTFPMGGSFSYPIMYYVYNCSSCGLIAIVRNKQS